MADDRTGERADIRLSQLAAATGLSALVIRAWERRYGFPRAVRTEGGHRRYAPSEVARVHRAVLLLRAGFRPREAIERALGEQLRLPQMERDERLQDLLADGEPAEGLAQLRSIEHALGFEEALEEVVLPALNAVGEGWASGRFSVAQEHAATSLIASWLGTVRATLRAPEATVPSVLLGAAPFERHGLPPLALEVLLTRRGLAAASLDADVPIPALVSAVRLRRPRAVVISVSRPNSLLAETVAAIDGVESGPVIYVGGPGVGDAPPGATMLPLRLTAAAEKIAADLISV
ncbi:MAG: cobalamin B12-binding domain-containing protein [Candidatus Dormibacteraeota bacterium]|nr:cobalamin B12-binding domain-containing protein [Candidatus Dormibacteraeota bacterium]